MQAQTKRTTSHRVLSQKTPSSKQAEDAAKPGEDSDETNSESASITLGETEPSHNSVVLPVPVVLLQEEQRWFPRIAVTYPFKIYDEKMGGVDVADGKQQVYSCSCKSKKWWHQLFYFFLDVGVVNAHVLETQSPHCTRRSQKDCPVEWVREMMALHTSRKKRAQSSVDCVPPSNRICERDFPNLLPAS